MPNCINCNSVIEGDSNLCLTCNAPPFIKAIPKVKSNTLKVMCVLTIVGSLFAIARAILYEVIANSHDGNDEYIRGWIYGISSVMTIIGAIWMLQKDKTGLTIYTVGQIIYILTVIWATIIYTNMGNGIAEVALVISMIFLIPSIFFLLIYWTSSIRSQLT